MNSTSQELTRRFFFQELMPAATELKLRVEGRFSLPNLTETRKPTRTKGEDRG